VIACGAKRPPLEHTYPSAESLAEAMLDALHRRDATTLEQLAINEREFRDHVWPALPAARPERNLPFSYVWGDLHQKSRAALSEVLTEHGGRRYQFLDLEFEAETDYRTYRVHRETRVNVREASGPPVTLRLCGSMLEQDGRWKVFSYVVD